MNDGHHTSAILSRIKLPLHIMQQSPSLCMPRIEKSEGNRSYSTVYRGEKRGKDLYIEAPLSQHFPSSRYVIISYLMRSYLIASTARINKHNNGGGTRWRGQDSKMVVECTMDMFAGT